MVCVACLIPLFLIPILNLLPKIIDLILKKIYGAFGWEYKPPVRVAPSCPIKPANRNPAQMNTSSEGVDTSLKSDQIDSNVAKRE